MKDVEDKDQEHLRKGGTPARWEEHQMVGKASRSRIPAPGVCLGEPQVPRGKTNRDYRGRTQTTTGWKDVFSLPSGTTADTGGLSELPIAPPSTHRSQDGSNTDSPAVPWHAQNSALDLQGWGSKPRLALASCMTLSPLHHLSVSWSVKLANVSSSFLTELL